MVNECCCLPFSAAGYSDTTRSSNIGNMANLLLPGDPGHTYMKDIFTEFTHWWSMMQHFSNDCPQHWVCLSAGCEAIEMCSGHTVGTCVAEAGSIKSPLLTGIIQPCSGGNRGCKGTKP